MSPTPLKMVIRFGDQRRVKCLSCKKFIPGGTDTWCKRCDISYVEYDSEHYIQKGS